ncbi:MAG: glycosyltransferase family 2 protein [Acidimicrobiia bacterium]|nr:glycosyltransferase family 2 protein [Acidimicrobiia bacterium]
MDVEVGARGNAGARPVSRSRTGGPRADSGNPDLSIVIVTYNSRRHIGACLESLGQALCRYRFEIVVVDNASSDGTPDLVRSVSPDAVVVETGANLGFARANNRGIARTRGRHVLVLNPDTVADPGSLDHLVELLDTDESIGIVAPRLLNLDRSDQGTARSFPTPAAALLGRRSPLTRLWPGNPWSRRYLIGREQPDSGVFPVDWVSGACLMIRRELADRTGGFDEAFFMYWEDADWCRRVKDGGHQVVCEPRSKVLHDEGARRSPRPHQVRAFHESAYRYYAKHHLTGLRRAFRPVVYGALMARAGLVLAASRARRARPSPIGREA